MKPIQLRRERFILLLQSHAWTHVDSSSIIIERPPLQSHASALLFTPTGSLVRKSFEAEEPAWVVTKQIVETDAGLQTPKGHSGYFFSVAFSPDSRQLALVSVDWTVTLGRAGGGGCVATFEGQQQRRLLNHLLTIRHVPTD